MEIFHLFFCFKRILSRSLKGFPDVHCGPWSGACCVCPVWTWAALGGFSFSLCSSGSGRGIRLSVRSGCDVGDSPSTRISTRSSLQAWRAAGLRLRVLRGSGSASCVVRCRVAGPLAVLRRSSPELRFLSLWCGGGRLRKRRLAFRGRMRVRRCWPALVLCCRREGWGHWASWHAGTGIRWRLHCWRI